MSVHVQKVWEYLEKNFSSFKLTKWLIIAIVLSSSVLIVSVAFFVAHEQIYEREFGIGQTVPNISLPTVEGQYRDIYREASGKLLLFFFQPTCLACSRELNELANLSLGDTAERLFAIALKKNKMDDDSLMTMKVPFPVLIADIGTIKAYAINRVPTVMVIDADRRLRYIREGKYGGPLSDELRRLKQ